MSTTAEPTPETAASSPPRRKWTSQDFAEMIRAGILRADDGSSLANGDVLDPNSPDGRRRWTDGEYSGLMHAGLLREGGREFLWDGEVIESMPEDLPHVNAVSNLGQAAGQRLSSVEWTIYAGNPIELRGGFKPQPDIALIRGPRSSFRKRRPTPGDIALLVEVTNTSYRFDGGSYLIEYARAGIPQYWIVNIPARRVEVYTDPTSEPPGYRLRRDFSLGEIVPLVVESGGATTEFEGIAVLDILQDSLDEG